MRVRHIPLSVRIAQEMGDHQALSRLGKIGAEKKKCIAEETRDTLNLFNKNKMLAGAYYNAKQANEEICPVD